MSNKNIKYLNKLQRVKRLSQPVIHFLDKTRLLPVFIPLINWSMRKMKIKRQFQKDLNYRLIGKAAKNTLKPLGNQKDKVIIIPFLSTGNSIFLLINILIAYRFQKKGYRSIFIICDKFLPICTNERIFKTREEDAHICSNCYGPYPYLSKMIGAEFLKLSDYFKEQNTNEIDRILEDLKSIDDCKSFVYKSKPLGIYAEKSVLRFFLTGELREKKEHVDVYRKFLKTLIYFSSSFEEIIDSKVIQPELMLFYNGTLSIETYMREFCQQRNIDYVTHETYVGSNSWVYKKNGEVMKLNWDEYFDASKILNTEEQKQAQEFIEGLRYGKLMYEKLNNTVPLDNRLTENDFVVLFTNLNFDTTVLGRNPVFDSMQNWIDEVIEYWIKNDIKTKLVIRIHPAELKLITASEDFVAPRIIDKIKGKENIILFDAADEVDSYTLIENMKFGLIYSSTIGLEIAYYGKNCLIGGDAFYKNQNFVIPSENRNDYFEKLQYLLLNSPVIIDTKASILRFIHFIYFDRVNWLNGISMDHKNHMNVFNFETIEELDQKNEETFIKFEKEILC
jgi:hypothetical protein